MSRLVRQGVEKVLGDKKSRKKGNSWACSIEMSRFRLWMLICGMKKLKKCMNKWMSEAGRKCDAQDEKGNNEKKGWSRKMWLCSLDVVIVSKWINQWCREQGRIREEKGDKKWMSFLRKWVTQVHQIVKVLLNDTKKDEASVEASGNWKEEQKTQFAYPSHRKLRL